MSEISDPTSASTAQSAANPHVLDVVLAASDRWHAVLVSIGALLAAAANVKLFIEAQWAFAATMLAWCVVGISLYIVAARWLAPNSRKARLVRIGASAVLSSVFLATAIAFFFVAFWPRIDERGPIIAIARFTGPKLPAPYDDCRPSDMLAVTLTDVAHHYDRLTAFELPYAIDPNGPWAAKWADWHGLLAGADSVVYGEYSFVDNAKREQKPDRLRISPETDEVPMLPLGPKIAPLLHWDFPDRIVPIDELCTGHAQRFLRDGKRLFLAIVGLQAFATQEYISAERALADAETSQDDSETLFANPVKDDDSRCDRLPANQSQCSGVLAFYLAALEQRLGHYQIAEREYAFAGEKLNRPAPFVDLAELYAQENRGGEALGMLRSAESADPTSVLVAATRAIYESQYRSTDESETESQGAAAVEFARAEALARARTPNEYEWIVLCRATYYRDADAGLTCRANVPHSGYEKSPDARIEYAKWLIATHSPRRVSQGIAILRGVLDVRPSNIKANYLLARALAETASAPQAEVNGRYLVAVNARAFSDDEFTDQGNAAVELQDFARAERLYHLALTVNPRFAYAYANLGRLHRQLGDFAAARADFRTAADLHPREHELQDAQATISENVRHQ